MQRGIMYELKGATIIGAIKVQESSGKWGAFSGYFYEDTVKATKKAVVDHFKRQIQKNFPNKKLNFFIS